MKNKKKNAKYFGRGLCLAVLVAMVVALFPQKNAQAAEKKVIGYGTLNASWVNLGLNWNMTGGTSGKVVKGETFIVYEKKMVNGTNRFYVYSQDAGIHGYISQKYFNFVAYQGAVKPIGYGTLNASWVNLGLNWEMTGGTSGKVLPGETFVVYAKKQINNTNRYFVYAQKAGIYGYISERFIKIQSQNESANSQNNTGIRLDVDLHVQETTTTCGVASVKMVLDYLGIKNSSGGYISEGTLWKWANSNGQGTYVYRVAQTLTQFGVPYKYISMNGSNVQEYRKALEESLKKNRPVLLPIKPSKNTYWKYNTGHYVLVTGMYEVAKGEVQVILNDCHFRYSAEDKVVPLSELVRVSKNHSSYLIVGK